MPQNPPGKIRRPILITKYLQTYHQASQIATGPIPKELTRFHRSVWKRDFHSLKHPIFKPYLTLTPKPYLENDLLWMTHRTQNRLRYRPTKSYFLFLLAEANSRMFLNRKLLFFDFYKCFCRSNQWKWKHFFILYSRHFSA